MDSYTAISVVETGRMTSVCGWNIRVKSTRYLLVLYLFYPRALLVSIYELLERFCDEDNELVETKRGKKWSALDEPMVLAATVAATGGGTEAEIIDHSDDNDDDDDDELYL